MNQEKEIIILFDGVCNLCNGFVQFVIKHDKTAKIKFASLQSDIGNKILSKHCINNQTLETIIIIINNRAFQKSTAVLNLLRELNGAWKLLYLFIIVPKFMRDAVYNFIAKRRYSFFGKRESCMVPTPELKSRFL